MAFRKQPTTDYGPGWSTTYLRTNSANLTSTTDVTAAPTTGQYLVITDIICAAAANMKLTFTEETSGTVILAVYISANGTVQITPRGKLKLPTANKKLRCTSSATGDVDILVLSYSSED